jgi:hypothetical protein
VRRVSAFIDAAAAAPILVLGLTDIAERLRPRLRRLESVDRVAGALAPFHVVSSYGLFSAMTTKRREIVIEGSNDGRDWREYQFRYKPGDVMQDRCRVAPHQPPRLADVVRRPQASPGRFALPRRRGALPASPATNPFLRPRRPCALSLRYRMTDLGRAVDRRLVDPGRPASAPPAIGKFTDG